MIVRTSSYTKGLKRIGKLGATAQDVNAMESAIAANVEIGDVIPDTDGLRKVRFGYAKKGKRGGGRTIYYAVSEDDVVFLLTVYAKVDKDDLSADEKRLFKTLVKELTNGTD